MLAVWQDVRFAARALRKAPGFAWLAVLLFAAGVGVPTAVFSLIDAVVIRPLPFAEPGRLVMLWERPPSSAPNRVSPLNFLDWSEQNHTFESMAAIAGLLPTLTGGTGAERITAQSVTTAFFDVLGIRPLAGRTFVADDARNP